MFKMTKYIYPFYKYCGNAHVSNSMALKFKDGDLVWAKIKGHPPWPAFVDSRNDDKKNKVTVRFYGSDEV